MKILSTRLCAVLWLVLCAVGCGAPEDVDTAGDICAQRLPELVQACPAGSVIDLQVQGQDRCEGGNVGDLFDQNGDLAGSCISTGSCNVACRVVVRCPCGVARVTRDEVVCIEDCREAEESEEEPAPNNAPSPEMVEPEMPEPGQEPEVVEPVQEPLAQEPEVAEPEASEPAHEPDMVTCPDARDCRGQMCGVDPVCNTSCGTCVEGAMCGQGACVPVVEAGLTACFESEAGNPEHQSCQNYCAARGQACVETCVGDPNFSPEGTFTFLFGEMCEDLIARAAPLSCGAGPLPDLLPHVRCCCQ